MSLPFGCSSAARFRLIYYNKCNLRKNFKWVNKSLNRELVCPLPTNAHNPNTYRIPTVYGDKFVNVISRETDWGPLHCRIERLYREGWEIKTDD